MASEHDRDAVTDVIVLGTGAAGLTAALTASVEGAEVLVLEKTDMVGGTSAWSGGALWVPINPRAAEAGLARGGLESGSNTF